MSSSGSVPDVPMPSAGPWGSVPPVATISPSAADVETDPASRTMPFTWHGSPWDIAGTCFWNILLTILTLGVYAFWGRTEIRRRLWSSIRLQGEPLAYHGTPGELARGFFTILLVVLIPLFIMGTVVVVYFGQASAVFGIYQLALFAVVYPILAALAFYRGRRYRLARTAWRGVRGSITGSSLGYSAYSWLTLCAYPLTLFWIAPYRAVGLQRYIVNDTMLGNARLRFEGRARPMYARYFWLWFLTMVLIGLIVAVITNIAMRVGASSGDPLWWTRIRSTDVAVILGTIVASVVVWSMMSSFYYARLYRYLAQETVITTTTQETSPVRFHLDVTGRRIMWLFVTNALITYLSFYILKPVATARSMKYYAENLSVVGPFDPWTVGQNPNAIDPRGEGLAQAFDLDAF